MQTFTQFLESTIQVPPEEIPSSYQSGLRPGYQQMTWDTRTQTPKIDDETMMKIVGMSIVKGMNSQAISRALGGIYSGKQINRSLLRYGLTKETRSVMRQAAEQRVGTSTQGRTVYPWSNWQDEEEFEPEIPAPPSTQFTPARSTYNQPIPAPARSTYNQPIPAPARSTYNQPIPAPPKTLTPEQEAREQKYKEMRQMAYQERKAFGKKFGVSADSAVGEQIIRYYRNVTDKHLRPGIIRALADQTLDVAGIVNRAEADVQKRLADWDARRKASSVATPSVPSPS